MNKLLSISGPTATGKTKLALHLAKVFGGELISADSRQVYKYMDIITGKDVPASFSIQYSAFSINDRIIPFYTDGQIKLWGYDMVFPNKQWSAAHFVKFANQIIPKIYQRKKLPIIVGGTGLYIKSFLQPPETLFISPDPKLRHQLEKLTPPQLQNKLRRLNPNRFSQMNYSDRRNPRRLIRAIEVEKFNFDTSFALDKLSKSANLRVRLLPSEATRPAARRGGLAPSDSERVTANEQISANEIASAKLVFNTFHIGLTLPNNQILYNRIDRRVEDRLGGKLNQELKFLKQKNFLRFAPSQTIGYRQLIEYLDSKITFDQAVEKWKFAEHKYARNQLTWFKKQPGIRWFDITAPDFPDNIVSLVKQWYYH